MLSCQWHGMWLIIYWRYLHLLSHFLVCKTLRIGLKLYFSLYAHVFVQGVLEKQTLGIASSNTYQLEDLNALIREVVKSSEQTQDMLHNSVLMPPATLNITPGRRTSSADLTASRQSRDAKGEICRLFISKIIISHLLSRLSIFNLLLLAVDLTWRSVGRQCSFKNFPTYNSVDNRLNTVS